MNRVLTFIQDLQEMAEKEGWYMTYYNTKVSDEPNQKIQVVFKRKD